MESLNTNNGTQKARLNEALLNVKVDVSPKDRKDCASHLNISEPTLKRYLTGNIGDIDIASAILQFLKNRIAKREETLAA